ncbi:tRNA-queuosine alpha-mannosyltransferase domain-containing protein [Bremerella sp. P1]|uniref:tRNA-queuosine alpha-mannosyltransferase domain-containing protein n=1 Tax=Bremerella sp. P1 TaxID=3026424 RepID=UPI0023678DFC|nr:DUF3524 domain-containing protein [Bremerella sp. P1]WDI42487.1 DUF3524 domain-containing protein [Bremerella sp. P1]
MKILALEPYYGGSHRAFLDGWIAKSRHTWTCLTLPAHHWKWRMRHAAITFSEQLAAIKEKNFDGIVCSDMLNLAAFRGLAPQPIARLPVVVYFHENQLTYPDEFRTQRDFHYAFDNFQTLLAADQAWFNSAYHRTEFFEQSRAFLKKFPDYTLENRLDEAMEKTIVAQPGLPEIPTGAREPNFECPHIVWAARWEKDKNPEGFFDAMFQLKADGFPFRLSVVGESFRDSPPIFDQARKDLADHIEQWGFLTSHNDYLRLLSSSDIFVSTAKHEFFGISAAEAILAGNLPVLPHRLAYPELVDNQPNLLYDGTTADLIAHLRRLTEDQAFQQAARKQQAMAARKLDRLRWTQLATNYDQRLQSLVEKAR